MLDKRKKKKDRTNEEMRRRRAIKAMVLSTRRSMPGRVPVPEVVVDPPVGAVHWRIRTYQNNGDGQYTTLSEITWLDLDGNPISTTGGTASGSALQAGSHPELYDGNTGTFAQVASATASYHAMQFPTEKTVGGVRLTPYSSFTARCPQNFDIEYSSVGGSTDANWTLFFSVSQSSWAASTPQSFMRPAAVPHRFWRNRPETVGSGTDLAFATLQFRTSAGVSLNPSGGTPVYRSQNPGFPTSNLFDGNPATFFLSGVLFISKQEWVGYDYGVGNTLAPVEMQIVARNDGWPQQAPTSGVVFSSADGITWRPRKSYSGLTFTNGSSNLVSLV